MTADPYIASGGPGSPNSWNRFAYVEGDPINGNDPSGLIANRYEMCTAGFSSEECFGPGGPMSGELTGNGNGGMYCDQALMPFITGAADCSVYSNLIWRGVPSGVAQTIVPVLVGVGAGAAGSGITVGAIMDGIVGIAIGIGIGEWLTEHRRLYTVIVDCSVHKVATANHESVGRVTGQGTGVTFQQARNAAVADANWRAANQFGNGHHAQHCSPGTSSR